MNNSQDPYYYLPKGRKEGGEEEKRERERERGRGGEGERENLYNNITSVHKCTYIILILIWTDSTLSKSQRLSNKTPRPDMRSLLLCCWLGLSKRLPKLYSLLLMLLVSPQVGW